MIKKLMNHIFNKYFKSKVEEISNKDKNETMVDQLSLEDLDELIGSKVIIEDTRLKTQTNLTIMSVMQVFTSNRKKMEIKTTSIIRLIGVNNEVEAIESIDLTKYHKLMIIEPGVLTL